MDTIIRELVANALADVAAGRMTSDEFDAAIITLAKVSEGARTAPVAVPVSGVYSAREQAADRFNRSAAAEAYRAGVRSFVYVP